MKKLIIILILINALTSYSMNFESKLNSRVSQPDQICKSINDSIDERDLIKTAVEQYYIKGLEERDFSLIRAICINDTKLYGVRKDSSLNVTTLDKWSKKFDPANPPFKTLEYEIQKIDYEGTACQVKILFTVNNNVKVYDFLNLLKIKGNWRIVNIIDY